MTWLQVIVSLVSLIAGALLSQAVHVFFNNWWYKKKIKLLGEWKSKYISPYGNHPWVCEDVRITTSRGKIHFESKNNPEGDHYVASLRRDRSQQHLVGTWESIIDSAHARGALLLTMHPLGNIMYGYFVARDDELKCFYGPWVLARKGADENEEQGFLSSGLKFLEASSHSLNRQTILNGKAQ